MSSRPMSELAEALAFLTILPLGRCRDRVPSAGAVGWYPLAGWMIGVAGGTVGVAGSAVSATPMLTATLVVATWGVLTRFLHWDGLADTADGLLGSFDRARRLEIMRDSHVGAFGVSSLILGILLQVTAVSDLLSTGSVWPLVAAPVFGRAAVSLACWTLPPARTEGLGVRMAGSGTRLARAIACVTVACVGVLPFIEAGLGGSVAGSPLEIGSVLMAACVISVVVPRALARSIDGMTGDLYGASVILVETAVLVVAAGIV